MRRRRLGLQLFRSIAIALWVVLTCGIFTALIVKEEKPPLAEGITGAWLIAVVATQSVAVLSALVTAHAPQPSRLEMNFFVLSMWLWGKLRSKQ